MGDRLLVLFAHLFFAAVAFCKMPSQPPDAPRQTMRSSAMQPAFYAALLLASLFYKTQVLHKGFEPSVYCLESSCFTNKRMHRQLLSASLS